MQEDAINKNKGIAHYQFLNRLEADELISYLMKPPPSNDEVEILGIEVRCSDRKQEELDFSKFDNTNINNYVCLVRKRCDEGTIGYHIPFTIPLRSLQQHLSFFSPKSQKLIGDYCVQHLPAIKKYNDAYWQCRY